MYWLPNIYNGILFVTITSVFELSEKTYVSPCFSLKVGRSDMTCFLFRKKYDAEVMLRVVLRYDTILYGHYIRIRLLLH